MSPLSFRILMAGCRELVPAALTLLLQSTIVLLFGLVSGRIASRGGPVFQSAVYRAALVAVLVVALSGFVPIRSSRPAWRVPLPVPALQPAEMPLPLATDDPPTADVTALKPIHGDKTPASLLRAERSRLPPPSISLPRERGAWLWTILVGLWVGGCVLLLGWFCLGLVRIVLLRRWSTLVTGGVALEQMRALCEAQGVRPPELRESRRIRGPLLLGWRRPVILLPAADRDRLELTALRAILIHELAHLDRRDYPWNLFSQLLRALLWPQPLLWALCRRIEQTSEEACDAAVLKQGVEAKAYASCLVALAERFISPPAEHALGLGVAPLRTSVAQRVQRILAHPPRTPLSLSRGARAGIALGAAPAVLLTVFLLAPPPRSGGSAASGSPPTAPPDRPILSVEAARRQLSFPLFVPRSLPEGARLIGVRVFVPEIADLSEVLHYVHSHRWIMHGYGLTILPAELIQPGRQGWFVNAAPDSPAEQAGIGPRARPLLALNGRPFRPSRDMAAVRSSAAPLRVTFQGEDGAVRTVTLRKQTYVSGPGMPEIPHTRWAALLMTYDGRSWEIEEQPTPELPRPPRYARHLRVGRRDVAVYGTHELHSGFWREAGVDLTLNNRAGMSEAQVAAVIRSMLPEPPVASGIPQEPAAPPLATAEAAIVGRVVDAQGRPVPGIRVMAQAQRGVRGAHLWAEDMSRADGSYRLSGLQTAPYNAIVEDPSQQRVAPADEGIAAETGKTVRAPDLVMTPGAIVEGTVTDAHSGQPVPGAQVVSVGSALPPSSAMTLSTMADRNGRYRLRVAPGRNQICVDVAMGTGERDRHYPAGTPPGVPTSLIEGQTRNVPLQIDRGIFPVPKRVHRRPVPMAYGG